MAESYRNIVGFAVYTSKCVGYLIVFVYGIAYFVKWNVAICREA